MPTVETFKQDAVRSGERHHDGVVVDLAERAHLAAHLHVVDAVGIQFRVRRDGFVPENEVVGAERIAVRPLDVGADRECRGQAVRAGLGVHENVGPYALHVQAVHVREIAQQVLEEIEIAFVGVAHGAAVLANPVRRLHHQWLVRQPFFHRR